MDQRVGFPAVHAWRVALCATLAGAAMCCVSLMLQPASASAAGSEPDDSSIVGGLVEPLGRAGSAIAQHDTPAAPLTDALAPAVAPIAGIAINPVPVLLDVPDVVAAVPDVVAAAPDVVAGVVDSGVAGVTPPLALPGLPVGTPVVGIPVAAIPLSPVLSTATSATPPSPLRQPILGSGYPHSREATPIALRSPDEADSVPSAGVPQRHPVDVPVRHPEPPLGNPPEPRTSSGSALGPHASPEADRAGGPSTLPAAHEPSSLPPGFHAYPAPTFTPTCTPD